MFSYRGPFPYSEPEAIAFARFVLSISDNVKLYLTLHSSAQVKNEEFSQIQLFFSMSMRSTVVVNLFVSRRN